MLADPASTPGTGTPAGPGPLAGIRILEVGHVLAGPYATMLLADLGAEVTKLEPPGGDISRQVSGSYFASVNRGKRSIRLDLATAAGQDQLHELVADAHALLTNLKPSGIRRLGLTYDTLRKWNERIVCVALTGYGLDGGDEPAFDYLIQAATGIAALTGDPEGPPTLPGYSSADNSAGFAAALGLLALIVAGRGGQVDVSMCDVMLSQLNYRAAAYLNDGIEPRRQAYGAHSHYVPAQLFPTASGYLALFITHDRFWRAFAAEAGIAQPENAQPENAQPENAQPENAQPENAQPDNMGSGGTAVFPTMAERTARRAEVLAVVQAALAADTADNWETRLRALGVPAAAVRSLPTALADADRLLVAAGGYRLVGNPVRIDGYQPVYAGPPRLGEHGDLVEER